MESEWTSEMTQWIGWSSDIPASTKQISDDAQSDSGNSMVFDESKQICSPLLQLSEFSVTSPIWSQEILGCARNSLRHDNQFPAIGINAIKREQESLGSDSQSFSGNLPPWFPLALAQETCPSLSNKAPLLNNGNQLLLYNNTPFLKSSPEIAGIRRNPGFSFLQKGPEKPIASNLAVKDLSMDTNKSNGHTAPKRPRLDTPAPFTAFKVRKEKLGDRITALQQLVSPFGKTDTASVLFDAIEYIKFLHDQVTVLSNPYMRLSHDRRETSEEGLRSKGLCLVPISTTLNAAKHNTTDFWAPTFGRSYR